MSTIFNAGLPINATGLDQYHSYNEGEISIDLDPISFGIGGFISPYTLTLTLDVDSNKVDQIEIKSYNLSAPIVKEDANTWTVTSNVQQEILDTISSLYLELLNEDIGSDFIITATIDNVSQSDSGTINVLGTSVSDAININQSGLVINEDRLGWTFEVDGQGTPQIADQLGSESGRTYRVTMESPENAVLFIVYDTDTSDPNTGTQSAIWTMEGTQDEINAVLVGFPMTQLPVENSNITNSFNILPSADRQDPFTITWAQEVIAGADGVPYVQEYGLFEFSITPETQYVASETNLTWNEDTIEDFNYITITDTRPEQTHGVFYPIDIGYKAELILSDLTAGILIPGDDWNIIPGSGWVATASDKSSMQEILDRLQFVPSEDYNTGFTITYRQTQTTDNVDQGDVVFNITMVPDIDSGYTVNLGPYSWAINSNTVLEDFATITDKRGDGEFDDIGYTVLCTLDAPATHTNGEFRSFGTGGTSVWDDVNQLTITGSKVEVQSHLDSLEWWSRGVDDAFTFSTSLWRGTVSDPDDKLLRQVDGVSMSTGSVFPSPINTNIDRLYDEDTKTNFNDETKT